MTPMHRMEIALTAVHVFRAAGKRDLYWSAAQTDPLVPYIAAAAEIHSVAFDWSPPDAEAVRCVLTAFEAACMVCPAHAAEIGEVGARYARRHL